MYPVPLPPNEAKRLAALHTYHILDTPPESDFDDLTRLAAALCDTPTAFISLLDADRVWIKSQIGIDMVEFQRDQSFSVYTLAHPDTILVVPDTREDVRFCTSPLVTDDPYIHFYTGVPLITPAGDALGTLCVVDHIPRELTPLQHEALRVLGRQVMVLLEQRRAIHDLAAAKELLTYERDMQAGVIASLAEGIVIQKAGQIISCNRSAEQILGLSAEQIAGRASIDPRWRAIRPDGSPFPTTEHPAIVALRTGIPQRDVIMGVHKPDGTLTWISLNAQPIFLSGEQLGHSVVASCFDITGLRATEAALRASEERYRSVVDNVKEVIFQTDAAGLWIFLNRAWTEITGFGLAESLGRNFLDYVHPDDRQRNQDLFVPLIARQKEYCRHEVRYLTSDGGFRWIEVFARLTLDETGTIIGTSGTLNDITERRRTEEAIQIAERQHRAILDNMTELVFLTDTDDHCISVNAAFARFYGQPPESFIGLTAETRLPSPLGTYQHHENVAIIRSGVSLRVERHIPDPSGTLHWHEIHKTPITAPDGATVGLVGVIRDITERKETEVALQQAKEAAEAAVRARSIFLATMSHEIRTPLNGVIGMTGLLLDTALTPEQREYAETVRRSGNVLLSLINDILDFSKIEAGKLDLEEIDFDLRTVIEDVIELLAEPAERKGLVLSGRIDHALPFRLRGDPSRLRQVLTNLVSNAVKFTERGEVLVRADVMTHDADGTLLYLSVADSGVGMSEQTMSRLFQPFMQADASTTRTYGGTGLGLAISHQLVSLMGGNLSATSTLGQGTIFTMAVHLAPPLNAVPQPTAAHDLRGKRVLIVDDAPSSRALLHYLLLSWDTEATVCPNADEALSLLHDAVDRGHPYHLALIDVVMPIRDGFALTRAIRADPRIASCAPILMTAYTQRSYGAAAREAGAAAFLTKPIRQSQLFDALVTALSSDTAQFGAGQPIIAMENLSTDPPRVTTGRILVVEDNQVNQKVAVRMLEKLGYQVDVAANGYEALAALTHIPYRLVLMDCHMPEMDGFAATAAIRTREGADRHTPIIALTANALAGERERCLVAGMDDYLAKPIQKSELITALARWFNGVDRRSVVRAAAPPPPVATLDQSIIAQLRALQNDGEMDILVDLRDTLVVDVENGMHTFHAALESDSPAILTHVGHLLKGSCAALGATAFAQLWANVEQHGHAGDTAAARAMISTLETEWACVRSAFDKLVQPDAG